MSTGKGNTSVQNLLIQEGVPTMDRVGSFVAEPVIYLVNNQAIGGFFRINEEKGDNENLNSNGMKFSKLCFHEKLGYSNLAAPDLPIEDLFELYKLIGELASIASGREIKNLTS
jgi:glutamate--cysteine ligase